MPAFVPVCIWCQKKWHAHCEGLRFTTAGTPFKPDPEKSCSCRECDELRERWLYCVECRVNVALPGHPLCAACHDPGHPLCAACHERGLPCKP